MLLAVALALADPVDVPAGSFRMGGGRAPDEATAREVALPAYRIDRTEVTIAAFEAFVAAGGYAEDRWWHPDAGPWREAHPEGAGAAARAAGRAPDHPVVAVTWWEADAYCRSTGGRLPTEAEWERAACGRDAAGAPTRYPWGDGEDFHAAWYKEGKFATLAGVRTEPAAVQDPALASPVGLLHAAGNVWEWTADAYDARGEAASSSPWRTLRGGSFANLPSYCTCTHREPAAPDDVRLTIGFRCAASP